MHPFNGMNKIMFEAVRIEKPKAVGGLKSLRAFQEERKPTHYCNNCKCDRYNPCTCSRKDAEP